MADETGSVLATWYNQAYLEAAFRERPEVLLKGMLVRQRGGSTFFVKRHEILATGGESRHILGLVPVYPSTADLSVRTIRTILHEAAPEARHLLDALPAEMLARRRYQRRAEAVLSSHFPETLAEAGRARDRLAFEELLLLQIAVLEKRALQTRSRRARALAPPAELAHAFVAGLPYAPTGAQRRVIEEIEGDLVLPAPMRRLLHGDVGSGKTMVAAYFLLRAVEQGAQAALMAPTEVLADQHYEGLSQHLSALGVRTALLKGSQTAAERRAVRQGIESGEVDVAIGTHALIQEGVRFKDLLVAVVDEQHRFGVQQRDAIIAPAEPDGVLAAHPAHVGHAHPADAQSHLVRRPRHQHPRRDAPRQAAGTQPRWSSVDKQPRMWEFVRGELQQGRQAYVVCPLIEESEALETASARKTFEDLSAGELAGFRLRLLHGQLPPAEKAAAMAAFTAGEADVLVSTSVIEVGVDVPNATVMVIMGPRRFGLSQLHQLRGRVGRGRARVALLPSR